MAEHPTASDEMNSCLLVTCTQLRGGRLQAVQGHVGVALGNRGASQSLWKEGLVEMRDKGIPWFPQEDVIGLFEQFYRPAGNRNLLLRDKQELHLSPSIGVFRTLIHKNRVGRAT